MTTVPIIISPQAKHYVGRKHRVIRRLIVKKWPSVTFVLGLVVKYLSARDSALSTRFEIPIKSSKVFQYFEFNISCVNITAYTMIRIVSSAPKCCIPGECRVDLPTTISINQFLLV
jgi:hypothetical protein